MQEVFVVWFGKNSPLDDRRAAFVAAEVRRMVACVQVQVHVTPT